VQYNFEWDPAKARGNHTKHGVSFEEAATIFQDPHMLTIFDLEHSTAVEDRWVTLGISLAGRLLLVCHSFREEGLEPAIRMFSARKAAAHERRAYKG